MLKILAAVAALLVATFFFVGMSTLQDKSKIQELEKSPDRGKLNWHAQMARAKGEQQVILRSSISNYAVPRNLDDALANFHLVIAEAVDSRSYATTYDIQTWYKFRLLEELSAPGKSCVDCDSISPPVEMLPLESNEFLTAKVGGETNVDGINITSRDPTFPNFEIGRRYLLLAEFDSKRLVAAIRSGPWGVFAVESDDKLKPVNERLKHPFQEKLSDQFGNSVSNLRRSLKAKQ